MDICVILEFTGLTSSIVLSSSIVVAVGGDNALFIVAGSGIGGGSLIIAE